MTRRASRSAVVWTARSGGLGQARFATPAMASPRRRQRTRHWKRHVESAKNFANCPQAANGGITSADRKSIQAEIDQLTDEIGTIGERTTFNGRQLLNGGPDAFSPQVGAGAPTRSLSYPAQSTTQQLGAAPDRDDQGIDPGWFAGCYSCRLMVWILERRKPAMIAYQRFRARAVRSRWRLRLMICITP